MKILKFYKYIIIIICIISMSSCNYDWLERDPPEILPSEVTWNDLTLINGVVANLYDRLPTHYSLAILFANMADYDEAMWSGSSDNTRNNIASYNINKWSLWNYDLIREINLSIQNAQKSSKLSPTQLRELIAELRFIRALNYFELVKRMGGVPIITEVLDYDFSGDPSYLQQPRNTESEVYEFIASEVDAIKDVLGNKSSITRANKWSALALKSRAMLYAGSLAKYNNQMSAPLKTSKGEVGIPAIKAKGYYESALAAAKEIITQGPFSLQQDNPQLGENFYEAVSIKTGNKEAIFVTDGNLPNKRHGFSYNNFPRAIREDNLSSSNLVPVLNLVEDFEYLDGSLGRLKGTGNGTQTGQSNWIFYDKKEDIFANKDWRLYGSILYPGSTFKNLDLQIQAGVYLWNSSKNAYDRFESGILNSKYTDGGTLVGAGGPLRTAIDVTNSGFYLRKWLDPKTGSSTRGILSDSWWVRFRLGEIYLNAGEAAFELGLVEALDYYNAVRERAGFGPNSLGIGDLTFEKVMNERRVELAFEDHRLWDLIRWRKADQIWDGSQLTPSANLYALYAYRIVHPGHVNDGKFVFDKIIAPRFQAPRLFRLANYYAEIPETVINNNKLITRNPLH